MKTNIPKVLIAILLLVFTSVACEPAEAPSRRGRRATQATLPITGDWVRHHENPVLRVPDERAIAADPVIIFDPSMKRYRIWFAHVGAHPRGEPAARIGYAESGEGFRWENFRWEMVPLGKRDAWDERHVETPHVIYDEQERDPARRYKMWYSGLSWKMTYQIGHAVSPDGISWRKLAREQSPFGQEGLVLALQPGEIAVSDPSVLWRNGEYHMWFSMMTDKGGGRLDGGIGYAKSKDGVRWVRHAKNPVITGSGWDTQWGVWGYPGIPYVLWDGHKYELWYNAGLFPKEINGDPAKQTLGYASSEDGVNWRKLDHPILMPDTSRPYEAQGWMPGPAAIYQGSRTLLYYPTIANERISLSVAIRQR